ncbi:MAG: sialate O-acetylesterase [Akkermansiaceae bacterium]
MALLTLGLAAVVCPSATFANTINVNLGITLDDANAVNVGENSSVGIGSTLTYDGSLWNNVLLRSSGLGAPTSFTTATQGGNHIDLNDTSGSDSGVDMTSSGAFYANFSDVSGPNASATGSGGMMQSYALANSGETISLSGLSTWAPHGYKVYVYFDIGPFTRTYGFTVSDSVTTQSYFTADAAGSDSDANNDGVMSWIQTTATTSGAAITDANYASFGTFTGDTLTISGADSNRAPICGFQIVPLPATININFGIALNDANAVDAGESSIVGVTGAIPVDGSKWNNVNLRASGLGAPTMFTSSTQGGSHIDLNDSSGADSGIDMTSSGAFYSNFGNTSSPNQTSTGDGGLLQSFINLNSSESISLSGLATWAPNGYKVYAVFDIGSVTRTYAVTMNDGSTSQAFWTADTAGTDADTDNDGVIGWIPTTATTSGTAVTDANYAVFGTFTGNTLTISGEAVSGRATLSGLQIVALSEPPATINSFTATPGSFQAGETVTLNWDVSDADSVTIDQGVGAIAATGSIGLTPSATTTWTLTATRGNTVTTSQVTAVLSKGPITVYLLSGQSNMQGTARSSKLAAELLNMPEIMLYAAGSGVSGSIANQWVDLQPANGGTFGPEIGFGERMIDLCPGQPIALIKYSVSGNSLEINFRPGADASDTGNWGGSFTGMVNTFNNGIAALEADGWQPVIHGMCWQQGEQDAKDGLNVSESNTSADDYGNNLDHFIDRVREQFAAHASPSGIRFVLGQVLPYAPAGGDVEARFPGRDLVRQAELDLDEDSGAPLAKTNTATVPTNSTDHPTHANDGDGYKDTDEVHLNHVAQLNLGKSMAYEMLNLSPQTYADWSSGHSLTGGHTDDDDKDGVNNLGEYFMGTDPDDANSVTRPFPSMEAIDGTDYLTISFVRNLNALGFQGIAQVSEDLTNWNTGATPVFIQSVKNNDGTSTIKYRAPWSSSDSLHPRIFLRLKISP